MSGTTTEPTTQEPQAGQQPQSPTAAPPEPTASGTDERRFSQADLDRLINERLTREREKAERERAEAERKATEAQLAEQMKFQQLADQRQERIAELEPQAQTAERYKTALTTLLERQRDGLPTHITALLDRLDPVDQIEWIAANQEQLKSNGHRGIEPTPRPAGNLNRDQLIEQEIQAQRAGRVRTH